SVVRVIDVDRVKVRRVGDIHYTLDALHAAARAEIDGVGAPADDIERDAGRLVVDVDGVVAGLGLEGEVRDVAVGQPAEGGAGHAVVGDRIGVAEIGGGVIEEDGVCAAAATVVSHRGRKEVQPNGAAVVGKREGVVAAKEGDVDAGE